MEGEVVKIALSQGVWCALFVCLLIYILKKQEQRDTKSEEREKNYQTIIQKLTEKFNIVEVVKKDVADIKIYVFKKKGE